MASLIEVLQRLYNSEINVSIDSDWDNGFTVRLSNQRNGVDATEHFDADELHLAAQWLDDKAGELLAANG